jgi:predicted Zn-dependent protease
MTHILGLLLALGSPAAPAAAQPADLPALERAVAARPSDLNARRRLADAYNASGRLMDAAAEWRAITELAPDRPGAWYALGHAYNAVASGAVRSFEGRTDEASWRELLLADSLLTSGQLTNAFVVYRAVLERMPAMVSVHDSVARIYERSGHAEWAAAERATGSRARVDCAAREALCAFREGRFLPALSAAASRSDPESRYWLARAATELAMAAFNQLEKLPDSPERRSVRATIARTEERHVDAIAELKAALKFVPGDPALTYELASTCYAARDYEQVITTLAPLLQARPDDVRLLKLKGYALVQQRRVDEALPVLQRVVERDADDPGPRLALGRAYLQNGDFAKAIPLIEAQIAGDQDGSLHVQLARAYRGLDQPEKAAALLEQSAELQRAAEERAAAAALRTITPPK